MKQLLPVYITGEWGMHIGGNMPGDSQMHNLSMPAAPFTLKGSLEISQLQYAFNMILLPMAA